MMSEIKDEVLKLNNDDEFTWNLTAEDEERLFINTLKSVATKEGRKEGYDEGFQKGIQDGLKKGIESGIEQGIEQGIEKGIKDNQIMIVKKMLENKMDIKLISKITGLNNEKIKEIQGNN